MWIVPCEGLISVSWSGHMLTQCYSLLFTLARVYWPECAPVWRDGGHQVFKEISHRLIKRVFFFFFLFYPPSALLHLFHPGTNDGHISPGGLSEVRPRWQLQLQLREQRGGESRVRVAQIQDPSSCCPLLHSTWIPRLCFHRCSWEGDTSSMPHLQTEVGTFSLFFFVFFLQWSLFKTFLDVKCK